MDFITGYTICLAGGAAAGAGMAWRRLGEARLRCPRSVGVVLWSGAFGLLGAGLAGAAAGGGLSLYGGAAGFALAEAGLARRARLPVLEMLDAALPGLLLGLAIARLGCLFAGCCRGPSIPYPLLDSAALLLVAIASDLVHRMGRPGAAVAVAGVLYAAWRFLSGPLRSDVSFEAVTVSHAIGLLVLAGSMTAAVPGRGRARTGLTEGVPAPRLRTWAPSLLLLGSIVAGAGSIGCHHNINWSGLGQGLQCGTACADAAMRSNFDPCRRGKRRSKVSLETKVQGRPVASLIVEGEFELAGAAPEGSLRVRGTIDTLRLEGGDIQVGGAGRLEARLSPEGRIVLERLELPVDARSALKALEPFTAGALEVRDDAPPMERLQALVRREMANGARDVETLGVVTVDGLQRSFRIDTRLSGDEGTATRLSAVLTLEAPTGAIVLRANYGGTDVPGGSFAR